jgi:hypothetical protein
MRKILKYLGIILIANLSFLFSPPPDEEALNEGYHSYIPLNSYMGVTINGDSYIFIDCAIHPSDLMQQNSFRQARALYVMAGAALGNTIYYLTTPLHRAVDRYLKEKNIFQTGYTLSHPAKSSKYFFFYTGYIILNIIILLFSFLLFEKIIIALSGNWKNGSLLFAMFLLMLASNQETKSFFWTPHQQLLNILTPLLCIHTGILILSGKINFRKILVMSLLMGSLLLTYGNMLLLLPVFLYGYLYFEKKQQNRLTIASLLRSIIITIVFFVPMILWIIWLKLEGVTFYNPELEEYREFVWITDTLKDSHGSIFRTFLSHSYHFLLTFGCLIIPLLFLLIAYLIYKRNADPRLNIGNRLDIVMPHTGRLLLFVLIETVLFLWLIGYYADRLTFSLAPILFCYATLILNFQKLDKKTISGLILLIILYHFYNVFATPLHFSPIQFYS